MKTGVKIRQINMPILVEKDGNDKIYICKTIVNRIAGLLSKPKQRDFVRIIVLHELYHLLFEDYKRTLNLYEFLRSEKRADKELRDDYPDLVAILEEAKKKLLRKKK